MSRKPKADLTRTELSREIAERIDVPFREGEEILERILHSLISALNRGERVELRGFGVFYTHTRNARNGRNPKTGQSVQIPPKKVAKFKVAKEVARKLAPLPAQSDGLPRQHEREEP
jgi:integration host factor subunit beta